jgi:hypothetical protein
MIIVLSYLSHPPLGALPLRRLCFQPREEMKVLIAVLTHTSATYARLTHALAEGLRALDGFEVVVFGFQNIGDMSSKRRPLDPSIVVIDAQVRSEVRASPVPPPVRRRQTPP